ncbi:MAG: TIR domain-containing protein [Chloroflexota bacterium]
MPSKYDIALSFAGEDREFAESLALALVERGVRVFYDKFELAELWGKDLSEHFHYIYSQGARFFVPLISKAYAEKRGWPCLERQSAQERQLEGETGYILPLRIDETPMPGLPATIGYIKVSDHSVTEIADIVVRKLGAPASAAPAGTTLQNAGDASPPMRLAVNAEQVKADPRFQQHRQFSDGLFHLRQHLPFYTMTSVPNSGTRVTQDQLRSTFLDLTTGYSEESRYAGEPTVHPAGYTRLYRVKLGDRSVALQATTCRFDGLVVTEGDLRSLDFEQGGGLNPYWFTYELQRHLQLSREVLQGSAEEFSFLLALDNLTAVSWEIYERHRVHRKMPYVGYHDDILRQVRLADVHERGSSWNTCMEVVKDVMLQLARCFGMDDLPNAYWDRDGILEYAKGVPGR